MPLILIEALFSVIGKLLSLWSLWQLEHSFELSVRLTIETVHEFQILEEHKGLAT